MLVCVFFFSTDRTDIKLCEVCGLLFPRKQHLNKQIEEFGHTILQKWGPYEIKSSLPLLAEGEWTVGAFSDGLIGVSAMASVFLTEIRHKIIIIVVIIIITVNNNNNGTWNCCLYTWVTCRHICPSQLVTCQKWKLSYVNMRWEK